MSSATESPSLANTAGVGFAVGGQNYNGSFGSNSMPYVRAHAQYHPLEWLGMRAVSGFGNISNGSSQFRTEYFSHFGLQLVLQPQIPGFGPVRPYLASGASTDFGTVKHSGTRVFDLDYNFYWPVEAGVEWLLTQNLSATGFAEKRFHAEEWDKLDGVRTGPGRYRQNDALIRAGVGLTWRFGGAKAVVAPVIAPVVQEVVAPVVAAVDSDSDSVLDSLDQCANTPAGVSVDSLGCPLDSDKDSVADFQDKCANTPAGVTIDSLGCPIDSDKDGLADFQDKCANTPAGVSIDSLGCPIDSDKDGVADFQDKCPGTDSGVKVDSTGCVEIKIEKGAKLTLAGILFATGKTDIDSASVPTLVHAAKAIQAAPTAKIQIAGFTDNVGLEAKNKSLSSKRAAAVKKYLVSVGVDAKQVSSKGYGSQQPVADNATDEGRAKNRRIEFRVK